MRISHLSSWAARGNPNLFLSIIPDITRLFLALLLAQLTCTHYQPIQILFPPDSLRDKDPRFSWNVVQFLYSYHINQETRMGEILDGAVDSSVHLCLIILSDLHGVRSRHLFTCIEDGYVRLEIAGGWALNSQSCGQIGWFYSAGVFVWKPTSVMLFSHPVHALGVARGRVRIKPS